MIFLENDIFEALVYLSGPECVTRSCTLIRLFISYPCYSVLIGLWVCKWGTCFGWGLAQILAPHDPTTRGCRVGMFACIQSCVFLEFASLLSADVGSGSFAHS